MSKINVLQLFSIIILSTGLSNHVIVIPILIEQVGRDAWISVIIGYILMLGFSLLLLYVTKHFQDVSFMHWLSSTYSPLLSKTIAVTIVLFVIVTGWITLKETTMWVDQTFLFSTPTFVIALFLLIPPFYISYGKISVIAICAGVLIPLVVFFGILVAVGTIQNKDYHLITPVLVEHGWQMSCVVRFFFLWICHRNFHYHPVAARSYEEAKF